MSRCGPPIRAARRARSGCTWRRRWQAGQQRLLRHFAAVQCVCERQSSWRRELERLAAGRAERGKLFRQRECLADAAGALHVCADLRRSGIRQCSFDGDGERAAIDNDDAGCFVAESDAGTECDVRRKHRLHAESADSCRSDGDGDISQWRRDPRTDCGQRKWGSESDGEYCGGDGGKLSLLGELFGRRKFRAIELNGRQREIVGANRRRAFCDAGFGGCWFDGDALAAVQEQNASQLPTGTVTFYLGKRLLGRSSLIDGQTTWVQSTQGLAAGSYIVSAVYAGDAADAASTAAPIVVTVTP